MPHGRHELMPFVAEYVIPSWHGWHSIFIPYLIELPHGGVNPCPGGQEGHGLQDKSWNTSSTSNSLYLHEYP